MDRDKRGGLRTRLGRFDVVGLLDKVGGNRCTVVAEITNRAIGGPNARFRGENLSPLFALV